MSRKKEDIPISDSISQDPLFLKAKENLLQVVHKHSSKITKVLPPKTAVAQSYEESIKAFEHYRAFPFFYPFLGSGAGNGALVELADGSVKYDFISGIGIHFGHCHPKVIAACIDAAVQDVVMQGNLLPNHDSYQLTELLIQTSGLDHCILSTSGAMANENALKIIFQKKYPRERILAFEKNFTGRTLTLAQVTDRPPFRENLPETVYVDYIPFYDWQNPRISTEKACDALKVLLKRYPDKYACMFFELIQGEAGFYPGTPEFFMALIKILKENGIAILVDEVQTFGRTDHLFAFQHFGLQDYVDVVTIGKLLHMSATLFKKEYRFKPGLIAQTFTSSTSCIRASYAIIESLIQEGYLGLKGKNVQLRKLIVDRLQDLSQKYRDKLQGPFGYGLMIGCTVFKGDREKTIAFAKKLFHEGVISYIAGTDPTRLRFLIPAGAVEPHDIEIVFSLFEKTLKSTI